MNEFITTIKNTLVAILVFFFGIFANIVLFVVLELFWHNYKQSNLLDWQNAVFDKDKTYVLEVDNRFSGRGASSLDFVKLSLSENGDKSTYLIKNQLVKIKETNLSYQSRKITYYPINDLKAQMAIDGKKPYYHLTGARLSENGQEFFVNTPVNFNANKNKASYFATLFVCFILAFVIVFSIKFNKEVDGFFNKFIIFSAKTMGLLITLLLFFHIFRLMTY